MIDKATISKIHAKFRQLRSGEVADNLKAQGVTYRLAWGVQSYRMREIAADFEPNAEVAEYLWAEDVRESKLLAPRLYPADGMNEETAARWADTTPYIEVADQLAMHLLSKLPYSASLSESWLQEGNSEMRQYLALMVASRMEQPTPAMVERAREIATSRKPTWLRASAQRLLVNAEMI